VTGRRTALVVLVPEAEAVVGRWRLALDPVAQLGVPAHVTVLFPFMPARELSERVVTRLAALFRSTNAFEHSLVRSEWFDDEVLWLAPDAGERFRELTDLVSTAFPEYPPYDGQFDDVVPHLTVADHGPLNEMRAVEQALQDHLPIKATARAITLMVEQRSARWKAAAAFALNS
jgi:2'-5' RNA ligase